jgi:integrase
VRGGYYPYISWRRYLNEAREQMGQELYTPHELRHVCASFMIGTEGWTDVQIANQMGHASITTTKNIYGHLFVMDRARLLAALNARVATLHIVADVA